MSSPNSNSSALVLLILLCAFPAIPYPLPLARKVGLNVLSLMVSTVLIYYDYLGSQGLIEPHRDEISL